MIKITFKYYGDETPRIVEIKDSGIPDENLLVDFMTSYMYDCYIHDCKGVPDDFRQAWNSNDIYITYAVIFEAMDVWNWWNNTKKTFGEYVIIEVIKQHLIQK